MDTEKNESEQNCRKEYRDVRDFIKETCDELFIDLMALTILASEYRQFTGKEIPRPKIDMKKIDRIFWKR